MKVIWSLIEAISGRFFLLCFHVMGRNYSDSQYASFIQFVKFGIIGLSNTVVGYGIYYLVLISLKYYNLLHDVDYLMAQIIAFVLSVLWSFYWNNKKVFVLASGKRRNIWKTLAKTYVSYSFTGFFLNSILIVLWVRAFHISEFIAPIINLLVSVPLNFLINKFWAFKAE